MQDLFLEYLRIDTQSNPRASQADIKAYKQRFIDDPASLVTPAINDAPHLPSSSGQFVLADKVARQLQALGCEVTLDSNAILVARLPASDMTDTRRPLVLFGHLDTATDQPGTVNPQVVHYSGGDITLSPQHSLSPRDFPELAHYVGQDIVVTDGSSLLGADDKAAIAAAVQCIRDIADRPHREVKVVLVPDEEIGLQGAKVLDVAALGGEFGVCLDCCGIGEYVVNNWNAGKASIEFTGRSAHPMNAKNNLKNAIIMANDFIALLPAAERPEHTENEEGYFWVKGFRGDTTHARLDLLIRDFGHDSYQQRKAYLRQAAGLIEAKYHTTVSLEIQDDYPSIADVQLEKTPGEVRPQEAVAEALSPSMAQVLTYLAATMRQHGIQPRPLSMRGGYDGCVITQKGLPTVNMFTGAHNFHSIYEYQPLGSLRKAADVLVGLACAEGEPFAAQPLAPSVAPHE